MTNHILLPYTDGMDKDGNRSCRNDNEPPSFQIQIQGEIEQTRIEWFEKLGFEVLSSGSAANSTTILIGPINDQSHLRGFLNKLWDLNFEVIQVRKLETMSKKGDQTNE
jgi:hypothetical protein